MTRLLALLTLLVCSPAYGQTLSPFLQKKEFVSSDNVTMYVNTTGSDTTGTGALAAPFKTIAKALTKTPYNFGGTLQINIAAGTYTEAVYVDKHVRKAGAKIVLSGAFIAPTLTTGLPSGTITGVSGYTADVAAATWTSDELKGSFIYFTGGSYAGSYVPVVSNTSNQLNLTADTTYMNGATFTVVKPGVVINGGTSPALQLSVVGLTYDLDKPVQISGIKFTSSTDKGTTQVGGNVQVLFSGCALENTAVSGPLGMRITAPTTISGMINTAGYGFLIGIPVPSSFSYLYSVPASGAASGLTISGSSILTDVYLSGHTNGVFGASNSMTTFTGRITASSQNGVFLFHNTLLIASSGSITNSTARGINMFGTGIKLVVGTALSMSGNTTADMTDGTTNSSIAALRADPDKTISTNNRNYLFAD
jgi:hypothetical protein